MHRPGVLVRSVLALLLATLCFQADGGGMQDMVAAALQYVSSGNAAEPASPPAPAPMPARHSALGPGSAPPARNISVTNSFAQAQPPPERTRSLPNSTLPFCSSSLQLTQLTGQWVDHPDPSYMGEYEMTLDCPDWAHDYDCRRPSNPELISPDFIKAQYRKIFQPNVCQLRTTDPADFAQCTAGRRIIMLGDSLMRLHFYSLACLLRANVTAGRSSPWNTSELRWQGNYTAKFGTNVMPVTKQYVGEFRLTSGAQVYVRDFSFYNQTLFDDVLSDFAPLQPTDVLLMNWGAWYPRFSWGANEVFWQAWQEHMYQLFTERLSTLPLQIMWKSHLPIHFGGATGAEVGFESTLTGGPWRYQCWPAVKGEFWYDQFISYLLAGPCAGKGCSRVRILPVFEMSLPMHDSHHGSLGRQVDIGMADCRHWCNNVVDHWSHLLYNLLCPASGT